MHLIKIKPAAPLGIIGLTSAAITIALLSAPNMNTKNNNVRKLDPPSLTFFMACFKIPNIVFYLYSETPVSIDVSVYISLLGPMKCGFTITTYFCAGWKRSK